MFESKVFFFLKVKYLKYFIAKIEVKSKTILRIIILHVLISQTNDIEQIITEVLISGLLKILIFKHFCILSQHSTYAL